MRSSRQLRPSSSMAWPGHAARVAQHVDVEGVLPRVAAQRARLELAQVDLAGGEDPERVVEGPRLVVEDEDERGLAGHLDGTRLAREQEEAGVVLGVVLDPVEQHLRAVQLGGEARGDRPLGGEAALHEVLDGAGRVVGRDRLDLRPLGEEAPALGERHRVGGHAPDHRDRRAGPRDQALPDAQLRLPHDVQRPALQPVVVLVDRAVERVLDRHERAIGLALDDAVEQLVERGPREHLDALPEGRDRRLVAERAFLALDGHRQRLVDRHVGPSEGPSIAARSGTQGSGLEL